MSEERIRKIEAEKQETREFIEMLKTMPKKERQKIKYIMVGVSLASQAESDADKEKELAAV